MSLVDYVLKHVLDHMIIGLMTTTLYKFDNKIKNKTNNN